MKKILSITAVLLCLVIAAAGCSKDSGASGSSSTNSASESSSTSSESGSSSTAAAQTIKAKDGYAEGRIGDTLENSFFAYTVKSAQIVDEYAGYTPKEGSILLDAVVDIKNVFGDTIPMYYDDFQVQWGGEGEDDFGYPINPINDTMIPLEFELGRAESREYHCVYEVPAGSTDFSISYLEIFEDHSEGDVFFVYFEIK